VGFGEDVGKKLLGDKKERKEKQGESEWQKYQAKRKEKRKEKKELGKIKKEKGMIEVKEDEVDVKKKEAELEMLVGKSKNGMGEVKTDVGDKRFAAVLKNKEYALDPTHRNFKKIADGEFVKEQKLKRRKMHEDE